MRDLMACGVLVHMLASGSAQRLSSAQTGANALRPRGIEASEHGGNEGAPRFGRVQEDEVVGEDHGPDHVLVMGGSYVARAAATST